MNISTFIVSVANIVAILAGAFTIGAAAWALLRRLREQRANRPGGLSWMQIRNFFIGLVVLALLVAMTSLVIWFPKHKPGPILTKATAVTLTITATPTFVTTAMPTPTAPAKSTPAPAATLTPTPVYV